MFDVSVLNKDQIMFIAMSFRSVAISLVFQYLQAVCDEFIAIYGYVYELMGESRMNWYILFSFIDAENG